MFLFELPDMKAVSLLALFGVNTAAHCSYLKEIRLPVNC